MTTSSAPTPAQRAGRREWIGLAVLGLPTVLVSLDISVLFLALPRLSAALHAGTTQQLWITDVYGFMVAGFLVTMGNLGDRIGRRRLLLTGAAGFAAASVCAAFAVNPAMLIAARAAMGVAGATLIPSTLALISVMFPEPRQQGVAIAAWMSCFMVGVAAGPVIGGALLVSFWWGSVFLLSVPVMLLLLVTGPSLLPESRSPVAGRLDALSVAMSLGTVLPVVYGFKELARHGWRALPVAALVAGAVVGSFFVRRQRSLSDPLLDLRLFGNPTFRTGALIGLLVGALQSGTALFATLYLQLVSGFSPLRAGLWTVPPALALVAGINLAPYVARRYRPGHVVAAGLAISALGQVLLTRVTATGGLALLVLGLAVVLFGVGPAAALVNQMIVRSAPPEKIGSALSVTATGGELGVALGIAGLGSVGGLVYRLRTAHDVAAGVPAGLAATVRDSLAGALAAADRLPAAVATDLVRSARAAFTAGLHTVALICAVLFACLGAVCAIRLRRLDPIGRAAAGPASDPAEAPESVAPQAGTPAAAP